MGFAAGINAGTSFMSKLQENERANRAEGRLEEKYEREKRDADALDKAIANVPDFPVGGLNTTSPVTAVPTVNAPPASVAATGGTGVPPEAPVGQQLRVAAAQAVPEKAPALGLQGPGAVPDPGLQGAPAAPAAPASPAGGLQGPQSPAAAAPAAPAAPVKEMSHEMKVAQALFGVAKAKKDVKGMNDALDQYHTVARKEIINDSAKMSDDDAYNYLHENVNKVGSLPMSVVKEGKNGYRVTAWSDDGGKGASALLSSADVKKLVAADKMMKGGYGAQGLELAGSVNKDLNAVIKDYNTATDKMVGTGNTATHYGNTEAETSRHNRAAEGTAAAGLALRRDAATRDKYQNADTWQDKDGNTYKSVLEVGKNGPVMKAFKIGGEDGSLQPISALPKGLTKVGGGGAGKAAAPKEIPAAGTMMEGPDGTFQSDGKGGRLSVNAPLPSERPKVLKQHGLTGAAASSLQWTPDGEHVAFGGQGYNVNDPADMVQLQKDMNEAGVQRTAGAETAARVAGAPGRRAQRETQMDNLADPNRFGPGVGLPLLVPRDRRDLYVNTDE